MGEAAEPRPAPAGALALVGLGTASALWSLFLWTELVRARATGATPFCAAGDAASCGALWDGPFASAVHRLTGVPVAGWGVVWGLVAGVLPLGLLVRPAGGGDAPVPVSAVRAVAAAGIVSVAVFLAVGAAAGAFCGSCLVNHLLVAGYAGIALVAWRPLGLSRPGRGLLLAAGATLGAYLLAVYPGQATPRSAAEAGRRAVAQGSARVAGTGDPSRDRQLQELVASLSPEMRQALADALDLHRRAIALPLGRARALHGPEDAPVRITEWSDVLCGHCAELHETLAELEAALPPGSFSVESRQFPLDGECNPAVQQRGRPVRCTAAWARICLEAHPRAPSFARALFARQAGLAPEDVFALAAPHASRGELEGCLASPETRRKLGDDVATALRYELEGTPLVLVNGRRGVAFPPFLYAMVLSGGSPDHPAFAALPPPRPDAHLH